MRSVCVSGGRLGRCGWWSRRGLGSCGRRRSWVGLVLAEAQLDLTQLKDVAIGELEALGADAPEVDPVAAVQVDEDPGLSLGNELCMNATDRRTVHDDLAVGGPAETDLPIERVDLAEVGSGEDEEAGREDFGRDVAQQPGVVLRRPRRGRRGGKWGIR